MRSRLTTTVLNFTFAMLTVFSGCEQDQTREQTPKGEPDMKPSFPASAEAMSIRSSAFPNGQPIPRKYTGDGADVSPPLAFAGVPVGAKSLALIMDDPDAPTPPPWVHWVIWNLPPDLSGLPEGVPDNPILEQPAGAKQGSNSWGSNVIGYCGPSPPSGKVHRYFFKLYALDTLLDLTPGKDKAALLKAMQGHVLAEAQWVGTYKK